MAAFAVSRNTFWELERYGDERMGRPRAFSDSVLDQFHEEHTNEILEDCWSDMSTALLDDCWSDKSTALLDGNSDPESSDEHSVSKHSMSWSDELDQDEIVNVYNVWNPPRPWFASEKIVKTRSGTNKLVSRCATKISNQNQLTLGDETTVVISKLPKGCSRHTILQLLEDDGFLVECDFIYLPMDFKTSQCFGYAIVNFTSHALAAQVLGHYNGRLMQDLSLLAEWSHGTQGLVSLVAKYRNSAIMHSIVQDQRKPVLLCNGSILPFPEPTEAITAPPCSSRKQTKTNKQVASKVQSTVVLCKIPKWVDRDALRQVMDDEGFAGAYDFIYVPMDFVKAVCFGFAIVNFSSGLEAEKALAHFSTHGTRLFGQPVSSEWSESVHGVEALVDKYRNSKVMLDDVPEAYKPLLLSEGHPQAFPVHLH